MEAGRHIPAAYFPEVGVQKLICNSFSVLVEASVHDRCFWNAIKQHIQLDRLLISLLLDEQRQGVRKQISETIMIACGPSQLLKEPTKSPNDTFQKPIAVSENPLKDDILSTIWDAFVQALPHSADCVQRSREFFDVTLLVFHSIAEKSPQNLKFGDYLKQWSNIMLSHQTEEVCPIHDHSR